MTDYFVAGGIFTNLAGEEHFDLVCSGPGEPPYVLIQEEITGYFRLVWQDVHFYRVEDDYTLSLVVLSQKALQWGLKAPERVRPDANLLEKLRAIIKQGTPSHTPEENEQEGCSKLTEPMSAHLSELRSLVKG